MISDQIEIDQDEGVKMTDELGSAIKLEKDKYSIKPGYDGVFVRILKHDGIIYLASHRKLDIGLSKWGDSLTFEQMYYSLGGPKGENLFSKSSLYSPYVHGWMIVTPEVANVTKAILGRGYLIYLGPKQIFDIGPETPFPYKTGRKGSIDLMQVRPCLNVSFFSH